MMISTRLLYESVLFITILEDPSWFVFFFFFVFVFVFIYKKNGEYS